MVTGPSEGGMVGSALTSPGLGGAQAARAAAVSPAPEPISAVRRENLLISAVSSPHPRGLGVCRAPRWRPPELCPSCRIHTLTRRSARTTRESLRTDQSRGSTVRERSRERARKPARAPARRVDGGHRAPPRHQRRTSHRGEHVNTESTAPAAAEQGAAPRASAQEQRPEDRLVTTVHSLTLPEGALDYTATTGTVVLREEPEGEEYGRAAAYAEVFSVSYVAPGGAAGRPVGLAVSGGPGRRSGRLGVRWSSPPTAARAPRRCGCAWACSVRAGSTRPMPARRSPRPTACWTTTRPCCATPIW